MAIRVEHDVHGGRHVHTDYHPAEETLVPAVGVRRK